MVLFSRLWINLTGQNVYIQKTFTGQDEGTFSFLPKSVQACYTYLEPREF